MSYKFSLCHGSVKSRQQCYCLTFFGTIHDTIKSTVTATKIENQKTNKHKVDRNPELGTVSENMRLHFTHSVDFQ